MFAFVRFVFVIDSAFLPQRIIKSYRGQYCGLRNLGHTCYINSCVQALLFTPKFLDSLTATSKHASNVPSMSTRSAGSSLGYLLAFLREFDALLSKMQSYSNSQGGARISPDPYTFVQSLSLVNDLYGPRSEQQDAQEFFVFLLSSLDDIVSSVRRFIKESSPASSLDASRYFLDPVELQALPKTVDSQPLSSSVAAIPINVKKRPADPPSALSLLPISSTPINARSPFADPIGLASDLKKAKRSEVDGISTHSLTVSEASLFSVDRTILPDSQDMAKEFELTYEAPSQDLLFNTDSNPSSMDIDMSLPSVSELPPLPKSTSILDFLPPAETPAVESNPLRFTHELFQGEVRSTFQCIECEKESGPRPEGFFDISLAIEEHKDLHWSLNKYFAKSILRGKDKYDCSECKVLNEAYNYTRITKLPNVLTIHLKRFSWNSANLAQPYSGFSRRYAAGQKLSFHIECPSELNIARGWLSKELLQELCPTPLAPSTGGPLSESFSQTMASDGCTATLDSTDTMSSSLTISRSMAKSLLYRYADDPAAKYELYAIIYHVGASTSSGHYTCSVRLPQGPENSVLADPSWAHFDDQNVSILPHSRVMHTVSEHTPGGATAYILLYRRIEYNP